MAYLVRLAIPWMPSFAIIRDRWHAAVLKEIPNERESCFVDSPVARSFSTSISRGVSSSIRPFTVAIRIPQRRFVGAAGASGIRSAVRGSRRCDVLRALHFFYHRTVEFFHISGPLSPPF